MENRDRLCEKCGRPVPPDNDVAGLRIIVKLINRYGPDYRDEEVTEKDLAAIISLYVDHGTWHFMPIVEDGIEVCPGSPSRLQYLEGWPRDRRGHCYDPDRQEPYRLAYQRLTAFYK